MVPLPPSEDGAASRQVRWLERSLTVLVVATLALTLPASRSAAPAPSRATPSPAARTTAAPSPTHVERAAAAYAPPAVSGQTLGVAAMVELTSASSLAPSDQPDSAAGAAPPALAAAQPQAHAAATSSDDGLALGDSRPPPAAPAAGQAPPSGATETLGPPSGGSPGPVPTSSPSPYANDTLTDLSKVPGAQWINWPAYTPQPHKPPIPTLKGTGTFLWPTSGFISTPFKPEHQAIDIANDMGTPIYAADTGTVVFADVDYGGLGNATEIDHGNGYVTTYGHQSKILVKEGDVVVRGQLIGLMGSTGHSTGPHLHFVIKKDGQTLNPLLYLKQGLPAPPAPQVAVPDFTNMPPVKAAQIAQTYHLSLKVLGAAPSAQVAVGGLFGQDPAPNSLIDVSATVSLHVSAGQPTPTATATATPTAAPTTAATSTATAGVASPAAQGAPTVQGSPTAAVQSSPTAQTSPTATSSPAPTSPAPSATATRAGTATPKAPVPSPSAAPAATVSPGVKPAGNKQ